MSIIPASGKKMQPKYLSFTNSKSNKSIAYGYLDFIMYLAPNTISGYNMCSSASPECIKVCIFDAGYGRFENVQKSRIGKTIEYIEDRPEFLERLNKDVIKCIKYSEKRKLKPCFRLDGTSDAFIARHFLKEFPDIQWYDYTKVYSRLKKSKAYKNYHLTFSFSGRNKRECLKALNSGFNVAVSFKNELPASLWGYPTLDGDKHDLRFLDPIGHVIGLTPKGIAAKKIANSTSNAFFVG